MSKFKKYFQILKEHLLIRQPDGTVKVEVEARHLLIRQPDGTVTCQLKKIKILKF